MTYEELENHHDMEVAMMLNPPTDPISFEEGWKAACNTNINVHEKNDIYLEAFNKLCDKLQDLSDSLEYFYDTSDSIDHVYNDMCKQIDSLIDYAIIEIKEQYNID